MLRSAAASDDSEKPASQMFDGLESISYNECQDFELGQEAEKEGKEKKRTHALAVGDMLRRAALGMHQKNKDHLIPIAPDTITAVPANGRRTSGPSSGRNSVSSGDYETPSSNTGRGGGGRLAKEQAGITEFMKAHIEVQEKREATAEAHLEIEKETAKAKMEMDKQRLEEDKKDRELQREEKKRRLALDEATAKAEKEERERRDELQKKQLELQQAQQASMLQSQQMMLELMQKMKEQGIGEAMRHNAMRCNPM